jgi:4-hydroxy-tetrahydrodipicolinate synthase
MFGSIVTAMLTPFTKDGAVDYAEAVRLANHLADNGTDTVLLSGTTGESPTLTHEEEEQLFVEVKRGLGKKAKVMAGTGSNCTATAIASTQKAEKLGVDSALIVVPYYNKPTQEGLFQHFKAVANATNLPLMIYNIPGRTSRNMEPDTVARLTQFKNYVAIKEASGDLEQMKKIRDLAPKEFLMYSGDDSLTLDLMKLGGVGVVSVAAHLVGPRMKEMINAFLAGDKVKAEAINKELEDIFKVIFITTNPAPVKAAMNMLGFSCGIPRLPLVELTTDEKAVLHAVLLKHKLVK